MTRLEIIQGVKNLEFMPQSNPTLSGMRIVIGALRDYAKEAEKINDLQLRDKLSEQAAKMQAAVDSVV